MPMNLSWGAIVMLPRTITGTAWSGPLFFGLKQNRLASRWSPHGAPSRCHGIIAG